MATSIRLYGLIITKEGSNMLVTSTTAAGSTTYEIPHLNIPIVSPPVSPIDLTIGVKINDATRKHLFNQIDAHFTLAGIKITNKVMLCPRDKITDTMTVIHVVENINKNKYEKGNYEFQKTWKWDTTTAKPETIRIPINLNPASKELFTSGGYDTFDSELDKCIRKALEKSYKSDDSKGIKLGDDKEDDTRVRKTIYTFYRPGLFVPPFIVDPVASLFAMQRYGIRSPYASPYNSPLSSPYSSPYSSPLSSRLRPEMPRRRYSPGDAPRVARSPRMSRLEGGFYEKYMKYKTKYLELKAQVI